MPEPKFYIPYSEHDFETRLVEHTHGRLGSTGRTRRKAKDVAASIRAILQDEVRTNMPKTNFKARRRRRQPNYQAPGCQRGGPMNNNRKLVDEPKRWFRVVLPHGNNYDKGFVVETLMQSIDPLPFWPIAWKTKDTESTFYVDDVKVAQKLADLDRQIKMPDGFKLLIKVKSDLPAVDTSTEVKEKMKLVIAKRYNAAARALDLTKFHADPDLQDYCCAMFEAKVFKTIIDIIVENIPDIEAMNLSDNRLSIFSYCKKIQLPNVKILHLDDNKFEKISWLGPFIGLPLVDLTLNGNPLCAKYKDQESYIGEVRKRFPKVMKLDGQDLPPPISFEVADDVNLPPSKKIFLCQQDGSHVASQFLEQYFQIYDTNNRQPLLAAYHESAQFSMTMGYPYRQRNKSTTSLNCYTTESRNLLRITDSDQQSKLLKQGNVQIVSVLQDMPQSQHDLNSFTMDMTLCVPQMISFSLTGCFNELGMSHKRPPIRYFFRTFVLVPCGSGFCIINETLHVTNATDEQAKVAFKIPIPTPPATVVSASSVVGVPPASVTSPIAGPSPVAVPPAIDDVMKQRMVQALAQHTNMNLEWSGKCLMEMQWDYQRAISIFTDLNNQGKIPADAFLLDEVTEQIRSLQLVT